MGREELIIQERLKKLHALRAEGIDPYPNKYERTHFAGDLIAKYTSLKSGASTKDKVKVCGRVMSVRDFGKIAFAVLQDVSGKIQINLQHGETSEKTKSFFTKWIDSGDFIGVEGKIIRTERGELSVLVQDIEILSKSILPLPEKYHGLKDDEERLRKRYLEIITNPETKDMFIRKAKFWNTMRQFLIKNGFIEVETPVLETSAGGAAATPFKTHHNALDLDVYLRISMGELWQKRLMVAGMDKTFEIGRQFRNEGMDAEHLQDYTQMEFYWGYANYAMGMDLVEEMYKEVAKEVYGKTKFTIGEHTFDLSKSWKKIDYAQTIKKETGIDIFTATQKDMESKLKELNGVVEPNQSKQNVIDSLWKYCRKKITGPAFLVGHPVEVSPLAKRDPKDPRKVERFQVILGGSEVGNGYSELNDPIDQEERFIEQQKMKDAGDLEAQEHDYDFVEALKHGMPPTCGFGVSERLFAFFEGKPIRETVIFPLMRPEKSDKIEDNKKHKERNDSSNSEKIVIHPEAKEIGLKTAYAIIEDVSVKKSDKELEKLKKELKFSKNEKRVNAMQEAYKRFGADPSKRLPSSEALIKRLESGKEIYSINTLVDAYNLISIRESLPMAAYDLEKVNFPIELKAAKGGETINLIGGEVKKITKGEMIYQDKNRVLCLDFNYRDSDHTKINLDTTKTIIFVDGCQDISDKEMLEALDQAIKIIILFNGGKLVEKKLIK